MMDHDDSSSEGVEPTPRRLADAKKQGMILRSADLSSAVSSIVGVFVVVMFAPVLFLLVKNIFVRCLMFSHGFSDVDIVNLFFSSIVDTMYSLVPMLGVLSMISVVCMVAIGGWNFSMDVIKPSTKHLSISSGFKRVFCKNGLFEGVKLVFSYASLVLMALVLFYVLRPKFLSLLSTNLASNVSFFTQSVFLYALCLAGVLLLVGLVDYSFKLYQYNASLRMSLVELQAEAREAQSDPRIKAKARKRYLADVLR